MGLPETWSLFIFVSVYSEEAYPVFDVNHLPPLKNTFWVIRKKPDFLGKFMVQHMTPEMVIEPFSGLEMIIVMLDDVEIVGQFDIGRMHRILVLEDLDILSPTIHRQSASCHKFMFRLWPPSEPSVFRRTNYAELFLYMMTPKGYKKWHSLFHPSTTFMWGIDLILSPQKMRIGIKEGVMVIHHFSSKLNASSNYRKMQEELRLYTRLYPDNINFKFKNLWVHYMHPERGCEDTKVDVDSINPRYERIQRIPCSIALSSNFETSILESRDL